MGEWQFYDIWMGRGTYTQWNISHRMNKIMPSAAMWMDLEIIKLSEVSQRLVSYDIAYM